MGIVAIAVPVAVLVAGAGAALAGSTGGAATAASAPPAAGKVCTKAGLTAKASKTTLSCVRQTSGAKKGKLVWVVKVAAKPATPAKPAAGGSSSGGTSGSSSAGSSSSGSSSSSGGSSSGGTAAQIAAGKGYFLNGVGSQGIACQRCHGFNALGDTAPKIAGKTFSQVQTAISTVGVMVPFFGDVTTEQMQAIAAYLQSIG